MTETSLEIQSLRQAQQRWVALPVRERLKLVRKLRALIAEEAEALSKASADARDRPVGESVTAEVFPLAEACRFLERNAPKLLRTTRFGRRGRPLWLGGVRSEIHRDALGVILIIGPGNYPLFLPGVQLMQALVAGNAVILKPGVGGSAVATKLLDLIQRAGFDPDLVRLLPDTVEAATAAIEARPDKVIFTGSAVTARKILAQLAEKMIPAVIEASGCDAVIVRADADPDLVVQALAFSLTLNAGATCMAPKRLFLHRSLADEIRRKLAAALSGMPSASIPLPDHHRALIDEARKNGASLLGEDPMVLDGVPRDSRLWREDIFGAVVLVADCADDAEAIARTNDCPFALGAAIFSRDEKAAAFISKQLSVGLVTINDLIVSSADARLPFGGRRSSGYGVTRGAEGLLEMTFPKAVTSVRGKLRPAFQPLTPRLLGWMLFYLRMTHSIGLGRRFGKTSSPSL
jgi:acyl-CoA reductase-like NAD-dependent aldehyde dehydrogenase